MEKKTRKVWFVTCLYEFQSNLFLMSDWLKKCSSWFKYGFHHTQEISSSVEGRYEL